MRPHFAGIIAFFADCCDMMKLPMRLRLTSLSQASIGWSSAGAPQVAPALFTRMSMRPNRPRIWSKTPGIVSRLPRSQTDAWASMPCFESFVTASSSSSFLRAVSASFAPISPSASPRAMFGRLRGYRLLTGFRGGAGVDLDALADAVARISEFAADFAGEIEEMDVNPLRCGAVRIAAVDALIVLRRN